MSVLRQENGLVVHFPYPFCSRRPSEEGEGHFPLSSPSSEQIRQSLGFLPLERPVFWGFQNPEQKLPGSLQSVPRSRPQEIRIWTVWEGNPRSHRLGSEAGELEGNHLPAPLPPDTWEIVGDTALFGQAGDFIRSRAIRHWLKRSRAQASGHLVHPGPPLPAPRLLCILRSPWAESQGLCRKMFLASSQR